MNIFRNKFLFKLIASICIFLTLLNFGLSNRVYAEDPQWGGILMTPIVKLLTAIADGIMAVLHRAVLEQQITLITISGTDSWWKNCGKAVFTILATLLVGAVAVMIFPAGVLASIAVVGTVEVLSAAVISSATGGAVKGGVAAQMGTWLIKKCENIAFDRDIFLPVFKITPEEIFSNKIDLFDINFFNPKNDEIITDIKMVSAEKGESEETKNFNWDNWKDYYVYDTKNVNNMRVLMDHANWTTITEEEYMDHCNWLEGFSEYYMIHSIGSTLKEHAHVGDYDEEGWEKYVELLTKKLNIPEPLIEKTEELIITADVKEQNAETGKHILAYQDVDGSGNCDISKGDIFYVYGGYSSYELTITNKNGNLIASYYEESIGREKHSQNQKTQYQVTRNVKITKAKIVTEEYEVDRIKTTASQLRGVVSQWYFILRNLAILVLMLILIYIGIKIVIGSTAGEKAKYKERLMDWLVAMCLVFIMHYIMIFAVELNEKIIELVAGIREDGWIIFIELSDKQLKNAEDMSKDSAVADAFKSQGLIVNEPDLGGGSYIRWTTDLIGTFRLEAQKVNEGTAKWVGYSLCYLILVLQIVFFSWTYLKRILYMAFLTIIAPLVAMTYPIDKITDGKAQAFDTWLKEYIFNLLIQPVHLLLYVVLVSSAFKLAATNAIYAIVAIGFIMPAEKLLRRFFGFDKAKTPGMLSGAAGAALAFSGMQKFMGLGQHKKRKSSSSNEKEKNNKIRVTGTKENDPYKAIAGGNSKKTSSGGDASSGEGKSSKENEGGGDKSKIRQQGENGSGQGKKEGTGGGQGSPKTNSGAKLNEKAKDKTEGGSKRRLLNRAARTAGSMGAAYTRMLAKKAKNRIKKARPIRALARGATGLAGAATFGMAGLALGVAGGDPSKAFQYASAGIAGGYQAGKGVAGSVVDTLSVDKNKMKDEMEMDWYGDEYKQHVLDKQKEELVKDESKIDQVRKLTGMSREEAQEMLRTTGGACYDTGITNIDDIVTINKMTTGQNAISLEQAMAAQQFNTFLPSDLSKMGTEREQHILQWAKEFEKQGYDDPMGLAQKSMEYAELFNKTKSGLKKA